MDGGNYSATHFCMRDGMVLLSVRVSLVMCCRPNLGYCDSLQPHLSSSFE